MSDPYDTVKERTSILGPTISFKGDLSAEEDLVILGRVEGTITHTQRLTIGQEGCVRASINAQQVIVEGRIEGDVRAEKSVAVRESAHMTGNITSPTVTILQGASFNGNVDMSANRVAAAGLDATPPRHALTPSVG